jgi:pectinesterase
MKKICSLSCKPIVFIACLMLSAFVAKAQPYNVTVAKDGTGNFTSVQAAIDAAPTGRTAAYTIFIKAGKYKEKISIPSTKPYLFLIGENVATVVLTWDDYSGKPMPGGGTYGTSNSASVTFNAPDCGAVNVTFENTTGDAPQALAINVNADRCAFKNCRFLGGQDTILTNSGNNRQYFRNCYVDGVVDFIFGAAIAVFDSCVVYPKTRVDGLSGSYLTAANTPAGQAYGYVFRDCIIPANRGTTSYVLGRPWQNDGTTSPVSNTKVIMLNTTMSSSIKPQGWDVWNSSTNTSLITYGEYRSRKFDSSLVDVSQRVAWSQQLTAAQAVTYYNNANMFGTWDPCAALSAICTYTVNPIAVSNFKGVKGAVNSTLTWNISWPITGVKYELFRSNNNTTFTKVNEQTSVNDSTINFNYAEAIPPPGQTYYYYILASKAGSISHNTDTISISSTPTITASGAMGSFLQGLGTPSAVQSYSVSGVNLTAGIVITAPTGYEISTNGTIWNNSSSPITLTQDGSGNVAATTISVRLNASSAGTYNGNIVHTSTGATTVNLAVTGTVQTAPLTVSNTLIQWPMNISNVDSAAVRATGVVATVPTFNKLFVSNGTTVPVIPSYSVTYGQAFGATSNGDGSWGTGVGGPGGNLNRTFYEQFVVTAAATHSLRVDSFIVTSSFYNTASNTRLAVVYSASGFTTGDSTDVTGGIGADGLSMPGTANGAFATPVLLTNETAGTTTTYRFALNGATGVTVPAGQSVTIRLYFSCGSSSAGRYAKVKNAFIKGLASSIVPLTLTSFTASQDRGEVKLIWNTSNEINTASFVVERSTDAISYANLGSVVASGNGTNSYNFVDATPVKGTTYYRLKMMDKDGSYKYSNVVTVNSKLINTLAVYPNPTDALLTVTHTKAAPNTNISIYMPDGKKVLVAIVLANTTQTALSVAGLPKGQYLLVITDGQSRQSINFIKQ